MLKFLHCVTDEKFIDGAIELFESVRIHNHRFVCINDDFREFRYIKSKEKVLILKKGDFIEFLKKEKCDIVILHNLYSLPCDVIPLIPNEIKTVWFAWGWDLYQTPSVEHPFVKVKLFHKQTRRYNREGRSQLHYYASLLRKRLKGIDREREKCFRDAVKRIDYFSGCLPIEYNLMKKNKFFRAKQLEFSYQSPLYYENLKKNINAPSSITGNDILVGNSAAITNNHLDVIEILKQERVYDKAIYMPLSYAGSQSYVEHVKK